MRECGCKHPDERCDCDIYCPYCWSEALEIIKPYLDAHPDAKLMHTDLNLED